MWLYIPKQCVEYPCVQDTVGWSSVSQSQNPTTELYVSSSGKLMQRLPSWRGWKTKQWIMRLSGMMLKPSMAKNGITKFISSLQDIHANHSPFQVSERANKTPDISGPMSHVSFEKFSRKYASLKMSKDTSIWEPPKSSQNFKVWTLMLKQVCFQRQKQAHHTSVEGSSLWPTPTTSLYCNKVQLQLSETGMKFRNNPTQVGSQYGLGQVARKWTLMFLLAKSMGAKQLGDFSFQYTRQLHISLEPGVRYSPGDLTFNPNFSDWIMGWPVGWSDPEQQVTEWQAWLQLMRGELSKLPILPK